MSRSNSQGRPFKEVNVEPLWSELGCNRFEGSTLPNFNNPQPQLFFEPEDDEPPASVGEQYERWQGAPTVANWRLNLIALSQRDNLFFVAYGDKVHVTVPLNVRQTLPSRPDLILRLPRSHQGLHTTGYIDPFHPHCVNQLMIGNLGDFEILLLCCDDGDVLAYYTRSIAAEIQDTEKARATLPRQKIMVSRVEPFFHENVGISAWGLAIHQRCRLIAVSSNKKEVTVFAFALHESPMPELLTIRGGGKRDFSDKETFPLFSIRKMRPHYGRNENYKRILRLHRMGHNIPSITFADNAHGIAQSVLAMDILGALWQLNIWDLDDIDYEPYRSQGEGRADRPMGWGVLVLPVSLFKQTKTPAEALGIPLSEDPYGCGSLTDLNIPFDISKSVHDVKQSSQWHPMFGPTIRLPDVSEAERREASATTALILQGDDSSDEENTDSRHLDNAYENSAKTISDLAIMELDTDSAAIEEELQFTIGELATSRQIVSDDPESSIDISTDSNTSNLPSSSQAVIRSPSRSRIVGHASGQNAVSANAPRESMDTGVMNRDSPSNFIDPDSQEDILLFKLIVNWPLNLSISKYDRGLMVTEYHRARYAGKDPFVSSQVAKKRWGEHHMPDGSAIMRIFQNHIDLQPPTKHMHHTVCKKLLKQRIPEDVLFQLQHIDRLSIHAVIAELNLVVIASQVGRAALLTLTRPEDSWSTNGPVTLFRVEMFLPLRKQEDEGLRPIVPLLGMTVGPMQSRDMIHKGESNGVPGTRRVASGSGLDARKRWRLILHYYDHTVLTYEISRNEGNVLMVL
ncbi:hypothetical protein B7463_g7561, partial [Scytalidium lignicola]